MIKRIISIVLTLCFAIVCCGCHDDDVYDDSHTDALGNFIESNINISETTYDIKYSTIDSLYQTYNGVIQIRADVINIEGIYIEDKYYPDNNTFFAIPLCSKVGFSTLNGDITYLDNYIPVVIAFDTVDRGIQLNTTYTFARNYNDNTDIYTVNYYIYNIDSGKIYKPTTTMSGTIDDILSDAEYIISFEEAVNFGITERVKNYSIIEHTNSNVNNSTNGANSSSNIGDDYE